MRPTLRQRLDTLERRSRAAAKDDTREILAGLSGEELDRLLLEVLVAHGADPETALEAYDNHGSVPAHIHTSTWAELVPLLPEAFRNRLADLKEAAKLGGAAPELVARLEEHALRKRACAAAARIWPGTPWGYSRGFAWVLAQIAAKTPEEEITPVAYYGPQEGAARSALMARHPDRRWRHGY